MLKILMVVAKEGFRDEELFIPKEIFEKEGYSVHVTSTDSGICKGSLGGTIEVFEEYDEISLTPFDAVVFVGGSGASSYFEDPVAHHIAQEMHSDNKLVCAICIAPVILAKADLLIGVKATVFPSGKNDLINYGCNYSEDDVVVDGRIITANGPKAAESFAKKICELLSS